MGKAANRRKIAAKRNEKPNNYDDRIRLAVKKGDENLSAMYLWHEARMEEAKADFDKQRAEHEEEMKEEAKLNLKKLKIRYELKIQKVKNEKSEWKTEKVEMQRVLEQAREWVNLIVTSQLTQNKRNTLLVSKAAHIGIFNAIDFIKISDQLDNDEKCEELFINPLLDMLNPK